MPEEVTAIQSRIDMLSKKKNRKLAQGIDLDAAKAALGDATSLWSKAQGAFGNGNLDEAVSAAKDVKTKSTAGGYPEGRLAGGGAATGCRGFERPEPRSGGGEPMPARRQCLGAPEGERSFADDDRGAADVRRDQAAVVDLEPHADLSRAASCAGPGPEKAVDVLPNWPRSQQIGGQHGVRVAADRILGDAERGAEHARFGRQLVRSGPIHARTRRIRPRRARWPSGSRVSKFGARASSARGSAMGTSSRRAALARDPRRHDLVQRGRGQLAGPRRRAGWS